MANYTRAPITQAQLFKRKRYLGATLVTCVVLSLIGGTIHILDLGSNRMLDMRAKAEIDLNKEHEHLQAAGEQLFTQTVHEYGKAAIVTYTVAEADALLTPEQWREVDTMVTVEAGPFTMGTDNPKTDAHNRPARQVILPAYRMDKYPVTNAQYARFVAATGHRPPLNWKKGRFEPGMELHPVTMISWFNAVKYAEWAGKRLPSEAEWEKAARGGDARRWPFGNEMDPDKLNTYYMVGSTTPVNRYNNGTSPYGLFDMAGNVTQWIADDFVPYPGTDAPAEIFKAKVAQIPVTGAERSMKVVDFAVTDERYKVMRGGSWKSDPFSTSAYHRNYAWPNAASDFIGFRCVQDIKE